VRRLVFALPLIVLGLLAPAAHAVEPPPTVIPFDNLSAATVVVDQYAGSGVHFGHPYAFGINRTGAPPGEGVNPSCAGEAGSPGILTVVDGGISGRSGLLACGNAEFSAGYDEAMMFDYWRRAVSFKVMARPYSSETGPAQPLTVRLLDKNGELLERHDYSLAAGHVETLSYTRGASEIAYVEWSGDGRLLIDNIEAPNDASPPPAAYRVSLTSPSLGLVEGETGTVPIKVIRFNGSTGAVPLSVSPLPGGIKAALVEPNPIGGTAPGVLKVTAGGPASGERQVTVTPAAGAPGSAGTATNSGVTLAVQLEPALVIDTDIAQAQRAIAVPGCGPVETRRGVTVRGEYFGIPPVEVTRLSGPVEIGEHDKYFSPLGKGHYDIGFKLSEPLGAVGDSDIRLKLLPPSSVSPASADIHVFAQPVRIEAVSPAAISLKRPYPGGEQAVLVGSFPRGCNLDFKDGLGNVLKVIASGISGGSDTRTVELASDTTSGPITAVAHDVAGQPTLATSPPLEVRELRNTSALPVPNSGAAAGAADFSWSDFIRVFGNDDSDACSLFGCFRDPFAVEYWGTIQDKLRENPGLCFGYSTMARRFASGAAHASEYQPGATRAWQIANVTEGTAIKNEVLRWQVSQQDTGWRDFFTGLPGGIFAAGFRTKLEEGIRAHGTMYVTIRKGDEGHAMVAYGIRNTPDGYDILTYNPNFPYEAGDLASKGTRDALLDNSAIKVTNTDTWSGGIYQDGKWWTGDMSSINAFDNEPPEDASMPGSWAATAVFGLLAADHGNPPPSPQISSISVGGDEALKADGTAKKGSGVISQVLPSGVRPDVRYRLPRGRPVRLTVHGAAKGGYGESTIGNGVVASVDAAQTARGQDDTLTVNSGSPQIGFAGGGGAEEATLSLMARVNGGAHSSSATAVEPTRMAEVTLGAGAKRADTIALTGGEQTLELGHVGKATTAAVTLGATGADGPDSVVLAPLHIGAGQRLELRPASWGDLSQGVSYIVRNRHGAIVRKGHAHAKQSKLVGIASHLSLKTKRAHGGSRVIVSGRVRKPGAAPLLVVSVQALRHGHQVAGGIASLRGVKQVGHGRFSVPVKLGKLPHGVVLRATATLSDESVNFASAHATGQGSY